MAESQLAANRFEESSLRLRGVPVLVYHGLAEREMVNVPLRERKYWLQNGQFKEHLDHLHNLGFQVRRLEELWRQGAALLRQPSRAVITFDDGLSSAYQIAYPLLREAGMEADFFVNPATIGRPGFLTWAQMAEMQRGGMSFQSHSYDHVYLTWLAKGPLEQQLRRSKQTLEDRLGQQVDFLSVPFGELNERVVQVARQEGYLAVCSSWSWPARPGSSVVSRVGIDRHTTLREFIRLLTGSPGTYLIRAAKGCLKFLPKRLVLRLRPSPPPLGYRTSLEEK